MPPSSALFICFAIVAAFTVPLQAATTSNLDYRDTGWAGDTVTSTAFLASSFTTGSGAMTYQLDSVVLGMGHAITTGGGFVLSIRANSSSRPGSMIGQLVGEENPDDGDFIYTPGTTIILQPNTTYWLVAGVSSGDGAFRWMAANSNNQTGDWAIGNNIGFSTDAGSSWSIMNYPPSLLQVSATAVPEPSGTLLAALITAGVCFRRRRPGRR